MANKLIKGSDNLYYKCPKCGCEYAYTNFYDKRIGVYCFNCDSFIAWTSYEKALRYNRDENFKKFIDENDNATMMDTYKRNGITSVKCHKCGCILYNTMFPPPQGQQNLAKAKYCPMCGRRFY